MRQEASRPNRIAKLDNAGRLRSSRFRNYEIASLLPLREQLFKKLLPLQIEKCPSRLMPPDPSRQLEK